MGYFHQEGLVYMFILEVRVLENQPVHPDMSRSDSESS